ncbi:MAG: hypothetical protein ACI97A_002315 [Planctomycetota bacterium]|jgi:hypothetical protein
MTRKKKITCEDIRQLLNLETIDSRPDRASMANHLKICSSCREHAPELAWFYGHLELANDQVASVRRRRVWRAASCAAVLIVAVTVFGLTELSKPSSTMVDQISTFGPPLVSSTRVLPEHFSTIEVRSTRMQQDNSVSSSTADGVGSVGARHQARTHKMEWIR